jgi:choline dehydrogenase
MVGDNSYTYENWLPYFEKSLNFTPPDMTKRALNATPQYDLSSLGRGGPLSITFPNYAQAMSSWVQKGMQELGIAASNGITSGVLMGSSYVIAALQLTQKRESSETAFLTPAANRANLNIYDNTMAKKIVFSGKKAKGVVVSNAGQQYTLSAKREVILAAGAFQSPQLLMVSGVGPAATLNKYNIPVIADRPGVGQNMQDHILMGPSYRVNVITASAMADPAFAAQAADLFINNQSGILTSPVGDFGGWEKLPAHLRNNLSPTTKSVLNSLPPDWPEIEFLSMGGYLGYQENGSQPLDGYNYATIAIALEAPQSRGSISISSGDTSDPPIIDPGWLTSPIDQEVAVAGYKRVREIFATKAIAPVLIGSEVFPGPQVWMPTPSRNDCSPVQEKLTSNRSPQMQTYLRLSSGLLVQCFMLLAHARWAKLATRMLSSILTLTSSASTDCVLSMPVPSLSCRQVTRWLQFVSLNNYWPPVHTSLTAIDALAEKIAAQIMRQS